MSNDVLECPVFDANSTFHQNLGLLKVAEMATRQHGDYVAIRASETRSMYLLNGLDSVRYWKGHQGHFHAELEDVTSNATISRLLLGATLDDPAWSKVWAAVHAELAAVTEHWDEWFHAAFVSASKWLVEEIQRSEGAVDLRRLCRIWSIRTVCLTLFGDAIPDEEMAQGLMQIEGFYFAMSTKDPDETENPENLQEYRDARAFLDHAVAKGLEKARPLDNTVIAWVMRGVPEEVSEADRIACLRPVLGRMLLEKLNIDGLGLLWTLAHLAQDPELVGAIAEELHGRNLYALPDADTPLALSVVKEGQRLYPELPFIYRITSEVISFGPITIPSRATVLFSPWLVQRDDRYWSQAGRFDGRRFLGNAKDPSSYFPFGVGPRTRARAEFILHQLTIAVRAICSEFQFGLAPDCPRGNLRPILRSTLAPRGPIPVVFKVRNEAPV